MVERGSDTFWQLHSRSFIQHNLTWAWPCYIWVLPVGFSTMKTKWNKRKVAKEQTVASGVTNLFMTFCSIAQALCETRVTTKQQWTNLASNDYCHHKIIETIISFRICLFVYRTWSRSWIELNNAMTVLVVPFFELKSS